MTDEPKEPRRLTKKDILDAAKEFRLTPANAKRIADSAQEIALSIEKREFGVDGETRDGFHALYQDEIRWLDHEFRGCPMKKIGSGPKSKERCHVRFRSFEHFLVHHHLHLMIDGDARTQKITNESARELVHPTQEKALKAALPASERARMLKDPEHRKRLLARRANGGT